MFLAVDWGLMYKMACHLKLGWRLNYFTHQVCKRDAVLTTKLSASRIRIGLFWLPIAPSLNCNQEEKAIERLSPQWAREGEIVRVKIRILVRNSLPFSSKAPSFGNIVSLSTSSWIYSMRVLKNYVLGKWSVGSVQNTRNSVLQSQPKITWVSWSGNYIQPGIFDRFLNVTFTCCFCEPCVFVFNTVYLSNLLRTSTDLLGKYDYKYYVY
jgi:hypothetical protein